MTQRIAVIPGDGIGPEVARIGVRVLESLGLPLQFDWFDFGADRYLRDRTADAVAQEVEINARRGVERLLEAARAYAQRRGLRRLCMAGKASVLVFGPGLWRRTFAEVARRPPGIEAKAMYVDALAMDLIRQPEAYEVIVTNNLFGDFLTDLGAALTGGLGIAASGNIHPGRVSLFEPVHGSAPDIASQGKANPLAMVLSGALMLEHLGHRREAQRLSGAVEEQVRSGARTPDLVPLLGGPASTTEQVGNELLARVSAAP